MVHPGAFLGSRKVFLASQAEYYEAAVQGGYAADAVAIITRKYFKRYPIWLDHLVEPSPELLQNVDDDAPDEDYPEPDADSMSPEEYQAVLKEHEERNTLIQIRKAQIKRCLAYQYLKAHDLNATDSGAENPYFALLCKLSGSSADRPTRKPAINFWRKTAADDIKTEVDKRATSQQTSRKNGLAGLRSTVAKEMFNKLPTSEKEDWDRISKEDHAMRLEDWEKMVKNGPSVEPKDRQRCIKSLIGFVQPILNGICSATGWKASLIAGGPEPACAGGLSIISVHSGTTSGDIKMNFGRAESACFSKFIAPIFTDFLKKSYSVEECKSWALPSDSAFEGLTGTVEEEQGVNLFSLGLPLPSASHPLSTALQNTNAAVGPVFVEITNANSPSPPNNATSSASRAHSAPYSPPNATSAPATIPTGPSPPPIRPTSPFASPRCPSAPPDFPPPASPCPSPPASPLFIDSPPPSPPMLSSPLPLPTKNLPTNSTSNHSTSSTSQPPPRNPPPVISPQPAPLPIPEHPHAVVEPAPPPPNNPQPVLQSSPEIPLQTLATQNQGPTGKRKRTETVINNQRVNTDGIAVKKSRTTASSNPNVANASAQPS